MIVLAKSSQICLVDLTSFPEFKQDVFKSKLFSLYFDFSLCGDS